MIGNKWLFIWISFRKMLSPIATMNFGLIMKSFHLALISRASHFYLHEMSSHFYCWHYRYLREEIFIMGSKLKCNESININGYLWLASHSYSRCKWYLEILGSGFIVCEFVNPGKLFEIKFHSIKNESILPSACLRQTKFSMHKIKINNHTERIFKSAHLTAAIAVLTLRASTETMPELHVTVSVTMYILMKTAIESH